MFHVAVSLLIGLTLEKAAFCNQQNCFTSMSWQCLKFLQSGVSSLVFFARDLVLLDFINKNDSVSVFHCLTTAKLTSKLQNIVSFFSFGVNRINGFATVISNKPSTCQHSVCSTEAMLFYLSMLSSVHRLVGREELRDLLEHRAFGQAALLQLNHSTYKPATSLK